MSTKLHELLAVEKDRTAAATAILAETNTTFTKRPEHFLGKSTIYTPFAEADANTAEAAYKEIVTTVADKLKHCFKVLGKAIDVTASKDATNQLAKADVTVNGNTLATGVPATTLLMLETELKKWQEMLLNIPTLAPGRKWVLDADKGAGVYTDANPEDKFRTKKVPKSTILVAPTDHHPAQIAQWNEDEKVGKITETVWCSMHSPADKSAMLDRVQELLAAVKQARQRANCQEVSQISIADSLTKYILG